MNILLIGSGGREHALAWKLAQSQKCKKLYCAPGNAGIAQIAECIDMGAEDLDALTSFATENNIDLVIIGPEAPLVLGLSDKLRAAHIPTFGPSKAASELEGSKGFMKDLCARHNIPTAAYGRFTDISEATEFIRKNGAPIVIKTDGLAAGKGVIIAQTTDEAITAARDMLSGTSFGDAGTEIVIEQFLDGEELSYFALADGKTTLPLTSAQDHKRVGDGDTGLNTGGMGAYSPAHLITPELEKKIIDRLIIPTIKAMESDGYPFTGVLFAGIMVVDGEPILLEHNIRFGDPECQTLMMRLDSDLVDLLYACATGTLDQQTVKWKHDPALCVVMAAEGYPGSYVKNTVIKGLEQADQSEKTTVFHAGTATLENNQIVSIGGRVLGVTSTGSTIEEAQTRAYKAVDKVNWPEGFYRRDIGWRAI